MWPYCWLNKFLMGKCSNDTDLDLFKYLFVGAYLHNVQTWMRYKLAHSLLRLLETDKHRVYYWNFKVRDIETVR